MTTNVTVTEITNAITVDSTTNEVSVTQTAQEILVNTRTNKQDIGLGNVDNTSDLDKPISTATQAAIDALTTSDIAEGTNLYFTNARADARVAAGISAIDYPVDSVNGQTNTVVLDTDDISEGSTNLYYTDDRVDARFDILATGIEYPVTAVNGSTGNVTLDTDDISEGTTNLYFTNTRADARVTAGLVGYATETYADTASSTAESNANTYADGVAATAESNSNSYTDSAIAAIDYPVDSVNGQTQIVVLDTDDISEGSTNLYYTDTRVGNYLTANNYATESYAVSAANSAVAALVDSAPETLDTLNELAAALGDDPNFATTISTALGQKFDTSDFNTAFDGQFSGKTTSDLAEGTNLYYTDGRFDTRLATKSTSDVAEGTNLYYTDGRFDTRLATKSTSDVAEGTNLYYTTARANSDFDTRLATKSTSDVAEGTNLYYTDGRFDTRLATKSTDDLTEGSTNKYYASSLFDADLATKTTDDLTEGDNLYFTDGRARSAVTDDVELALDGDTVYVKSLRDTTRVKGSLEMTRDDNYVFPPTTSNWTVGNNGFDMASSGDGWLPSASTSLFLRDTFAYTNAGTGFAMRTADGTSATTGTNPWFGTANTGPLQTPSDTLMGTINWNGYATGTPGNDWTNNFATNSMGGGIRVNHSLQLQGYTTEAPTTTTVSVTPLSQNARFNATVTGTSILTTAGVFSYTGTAPSPGQVIRIFGAPTGTGSIVGYTSGKLYHCVARDTTALTFTISETPNGLPVTTVAGTTTGMTIQRCGYAVNIASTDPIPFYNGSRVRVSGFGSQIPDGEYTVYQATNTVIGIGVYTTANPTITGSTLYEADTVIGGAGIRARAFPTGTIWNNNTRTNLFDHNLTSATYQSDSFTFNDASGAALPGGDIHYSRSTLAVHNHSTIAPAAVDTIYDMTFDETPYISENITLASNKQITFAVAGRYKIRFNGQAVNGGSSAAHAYVWITKNGTGTGDQVADSAFDITLLKSNSGNSAQLIGMEWIVDVAANDYFVIQFAADSTDVSLVAEAAQTSPYARPAVASAHLKVEPIGA